MWFQLRKYFFLTLGIWVSMPFHLSGDILFEHSSREVTFENPLYPIVAPREEGYLQVSDMHTIFYAAYGNPDGIPIVFLHGGPGGGCSDAMVRTFDLKKWNVIMFDQRGAMRSKPFACMEENTPQHSVADIELLRHHFGIEKWVVFGGSWGSTLALLYGQEHPERCAGFILRGVMLGRKQDYLHLFYDMGNIFPEAYDDVVNYIPEAERGDLLLAYEKRMNDPDPEIQLAAARIFMQFDAVCATARPNPAFVQAMLENDRLILSVMKAFCHYAKHGFFLEEDQILSRMGSIEHLPALIINGRWDAICPPGQAFALHKKWRNSQLWIVPDGGHSGSESPISSALIEATDLFAGHFIEE